MNSPTPTSGGGKATPPAPAVRTQLMEAVGRKLDYVLTADTPDLRDLPTRATHLRFHQ